MKNQILNNSLNLGAALPRVYRKLSARFPQAFKLLANRLVLFPWVGTRNWGILDAYEDFAG